MLKSKDFVVGSVRKVLHLLVLMWELECLQVLLCLCALLLWLCLHWTLMEELGSTFLRVPMK